jgi:hypothetical protein
MDLSWVFGLGGHRLRAQSPGLPRRFESDATP